MNAKTLELKAALNRSRHAAKRHGGELTTIQKASRFRLQQLLDTEHQDRPDGAVSEAISAHNKVFSKTECTTKAPTTPVLSKNDHHRQTVTTMALAACTALVNGDTCESMELAVSALRAAANYTDENEDQS